MGADAGIWIDTDLALGADRGDVDDGFAVAAVLRAAAREGSGLPVLGISAVSGNTDGATAFEAIRQLLEAAGPGAAPPVVVAEPDAPAALAALPRGTRILAIGPPTNLARALAVDPSGLDREVHLVGSVAHPWRHPVLACSDLNFRRDRRATRAVLAAPFARRVVHPLDVVRALSFDEGDLARIGHAGSLGAYLARHSARWWRRTRRLGRAAFPVWDLVPALLFVGALPSARFNADGSRLAAFDNRAAKEAFFRLLEER